MGWGLTQKRQEDKIEFEIPDDVKAKIEAGEKASLELAEVKAKLESRDTEIQNFKTELDTIKTSLAAQVTKEPVKVDEEVDFFTDPKGAVDKAIGKNLLPVVNAFAEMRAEKVFDDLVQAHPELKFSEVSKEFEAVTAKFGITHKANRELMENTFRVVRDRLREQGKLDSPEYTNFMELSRSGGNSGSQYYKQDDTKTKKFNPDEQEFLARYGITEKEASDFIAERRVQ